MSISLMKLIQSDMWKACRASSQSTSVCGPHTLASLSFQDHPFTGNHPRTCLYRTTRANRSNNAATATAQLETKRLQIGHQLVDQSQHHKIWTMPPPWLVHVWASHALYRVSLQSV